MISANLTLSSIFGLLFSKIPHFNAHFALLLVKLALLGRILSDLWAILGVISDFKCGRNVNSKGYRSLTLRFLSILKRILKFSFLHEHFF